jgi:hypothetical protein
MWWLNVPNSLVTNANSALLHILMLLTDVNIQTYFFYTTLCIASGPILHSKQLTAIRKIRLEEWSGGVCHWFGSGLEDFGRWSGVPSVNFKGHP